VPERTSTDDDYFDWTGGYMLGNAIGTHHPFDLTDEEAEQELQRIREAEAKRITPGFTLPGGGSPS
jgi:hypothetical protein